MAGTKVANVPQPQPGFGAFNLAAPVIMQMNPCGGWEKQKPESIEEEKLKAVIQHLVNSQTVAAAQSFCKQCAIDNKKLDGGKNTSGYVPIIMMPIYSADNCPFDLNCEVQKLKDSEKKPQKKTAKDAAKSSGKEDEDKTVTSRKKKVYFLQRLTDFDLLSQW